MNVFIERPWALYALLLVIPSLYVSLRQLKRLRVFAGDFYRIRTAAAPNSVFLSVRQKILCRIVFWNAAWILLVLAYSGMYWGSAPEQITRRGAAASFVFDISYSMTAADGGGGLTRLEAAAAYAESLLSRMEGIPVSAVLAKGAGICAVPLTEDHNAIAALLPALSPRLMTAAGSSPGGGIAAAVQSFPQQLGASPVIIVFTDGEETDALMETSALQAAAYGMTVIFVGFGSENGTEVFAGDGVTPVTSALQAERLSAIAEKAQTAASGIAARNRHERVLFVTAAAAGSAVRVLRVIADQVSEITTAYEMRPVPRYPLFICAALLCMLLGFVLPEIPPCARKIRAADDRRRGLLQLLCVLCVCALSSCGAGSAGALHVFKGSLAWRQGAYRDAAGEFLQTIEIAEAQKNSELWQYGAAGLASSYIMLGEDAAARERLLRIPEDAVHAVRFAAAYNAALLSYRGGDYERAAALFKKALEADSTSIEAKINFEIASRQAAASAAAGGRRDMLPAAEEVSADTASDVLFSLIRKKELDIWKKQQTEQSPDSALDY